MPRVFRAATRTPTVWMDEAERMLPEHERIDGQRWCARVIRHVNVWQ